MRLVAPHCLVVETCVVELLANRDTFGSKHRASSSTGRHRCFCPLLLMFELMGSGWELLVVQFFVVHKIPYTRAMHVAGCESSEPHLASRPFADRRLVSTTHPLPWLPYGAQTHSSAHSSKFVPHDTRRHINCKGILQSKLYALGVWQCPSCCCPHPTT